MRVRPLDSPAAAGAIDAHMAASALAWLAACGLDTIVAASPRNWLAPPKLPARSPAPASAPAHVPAVPRFETLDALATALRSLSHPLNTGNPPALAHGPVAAPLLVLSEQPLEAEGQEQALLAAMLAAIGLDIADVARAAILPWPAPAGRAARDSEVELFRPWLDAALALLRPRLLLGLGSRPARLADPASPPSALRGRALAYAGRPMLATFAPAMLLSQPALKAAAWEDLQRLQAMLAGVTP